MELELFQYIDQVLEELENMKVDLDIASREIEEFFERLLHETNEGYLNINSRVKSKHSLKEKIIRYDYFNTYKTVEALFADLSDLIGLRIECRFISDEVAMCQYLMKYFTKRSKDYPGFVYNKSNPNILLELTSKQPKNQKNGIKMYRIDGKYVYGENTINFEIQIKSMVNIFWSEIEHKVIYKNYNYIIADKFYKDIMKSIKNSLTTIDQQLLLISNQFDQRFQNSLDLRKDQLEKLLSKTVYDLFAEKMKKNIGVLVDFRKSCDTLVKYVFRETLKDDDLQHHTILYNMFMRLKDIESQEMEFNEELEFEREFQFEDDFSLVMGTFIKQIINKEFQWHLFFKILFTLEPDNNTGDLENFITFYKDRICQNLQLESLKENFSEDEINQIVRVLMIKFAQLFIIINTIELLYDTTIDQVIGILDGVIAAIASNIREYSEWEKEKGIYLQLFELRLMSKFNMDIKATEVLDFLEEVRQSDSNIEIHTSILKYIDKL
ncbi:MAG: GTP pyrophosphokinase [Cellulosilyticaceae bacterium]